MSHWKVVEFFSHSRRQKKLNKLTAKRIRNKSIKGHSSIQSKLIVISLLPFKEALIMLMIWNQSFLSFGRLLWNLTSEKLIWKQKSIKFLIVKIVNYELKLCGTADFQIFLQVIRSQKKKKTLVSPNIPLLTAKKTNSYGFLGCRCWEWDISLTGEAILEKTQKGIWLRSWNEDQKVLCFLRGLLY